MHFKDPPQKKVPIKQGSNMCISLHERNPYLLTIRRPSIWISGRNWRAWNETLHLSLWISAMVGGSTDCRHETSKIWTEKQWKEAVPLTKKKEHKEAFEREKMHGKI
jgi:hypothetical protein